MKGTRQPGYSVAAWMLSLACGAEAICAQTFAEFPIPTSNSETLSLANGPDGAIWFAERDGNKIGRIDSAGAFTEYPVPVASSKPREIVLGPEGNFWFFGRHAGSLDFSLWRLTPGGVFTEFAVPPPAALGRALTAGSDGNLWFANSDATNPNAPISQIARMTTSGVVTQFPLTDGTYSVYGMTLGLDGNCWFTESNPSNPADYRISRITPAGAISDFPLPTNSGTPTAITAGPDGNLWFLNEGGSVDSAIGRMTTSGVVTHFPAAQAPFNSTLRSSPDGTMWFSNAQPGQLAQLRTSGDATYFPPATPSGGFFGIAIGSDGAVWTSGDDSIVRLSIGSSPCVPDAHTLCLNNNRFRVAASWRKIDGSTGEGTGVALTSDSGYFWFFNSANIELVLKVLNACPINPPRFWVFAAGLTNVEVTMTVTDTQTGSSKVYTNPLGTAFAPIQDTSAFATCQ